MRLRATEPDASEPMPSQRFSSVDASIEDPRAALLAAPMSLYQKIAVAMTVCLCMLDGYDVFAITFAAPAIKAAWRVGDAQLGAVLASGLLGMAAGSLLIAPAADRIGRRPMIFLSLILMIVSTLWSATTYDTTELMLSRVVTGLGIGAMIAVISSLAAEYANARRRDLCVLLMGIGFPLGGTLGGFLAAYLLPTRGWRAIFIMAACLGLIMLLASWVLLPEPIAPLIARPRRNTLARINAFLERSGLAPISKLPAPPPDAKSAPLTALFATGAASATVLITCIYFLHVVTLFFVQSWVPSLIAGEGFPPAQAAFTAAWLNIGGILGGLFIGGTSMRLGLKRLLFVSLSCGAMLTALFGSIPANILLLALGAALMGLCMQGGMMGLYAVVARSFPAHMRVSGTGLVIGVGRVGSALGPAAAGLLMAAGAARSSVAVIMAIPTLAAALILLRFKVRPPDTP